MPYGGYLNFLNEPIRRVLLLILKQQKQEGHWALGRSPMNG